MSNPQLVHITGLIDSAKLETYSTVVAKQFDRGHREVLRAIDNLIKLDPELGRCNFAQTNYLDSQGREQRCYSMDRDGWMLVVMGFTGAKALEIKKSFIAAFNAMEQELLDRKVDWQSKLYKNRTREVQARLGSRSYLKNKPKKSRDQETIEDLCDLFGV